MGMVRRSNPITVVLLLCVALYPFQVAFGCGEGTVPSATGPVWVLVTLPFTLVECFSADAAAFLLGSTWGSYGALIMCASLAIAFVGSINIFITMHREQTPSRRGAVTTVLFGVLFLWLFLVRAGPTVYFC